MGISIQMSGIGERLREERERIGLSQGAFGEIGGVKANAQGNYEKGERYPDAAYLACLSARGVDVLYVVTGQRTPMPADSLSAGEALILDNYRALSDKDRDAVARLMAGLLLVNATP